MGAQYTKEQKELFLKYQPIVHEACVYTSKFDDLNRFLCADLVAGMPNVGIVLVDIVKKHIKSNTLTDQSKYFALALLKSFVDTGNQQLVKYLPTRMFSRFGKMATHRKAETAIQRGRDVLKVHSGSGAGGNAAAIGRASC